MNGIIKFFNASKNYGFITGDDGKDFFYHISGVEGEQVLNEGEKVSFEVEQGDRGEKAVKIKKLDDATEEVAETEETTE